MTKLVRRVVAFLGSARLAFGLLAFVGVWVALGTFVPQGDVSAPDIAAWTAAHPLAAAAARVLGLHRAFGAPPFMLGVAALALATAVCAWRRTKVALSRARMLREASAGPLEAGEHDIEIACDPSLTAEETLDRAAESLAGVGVRTQRRDATLFAVSAPWTVWGSPVFHWGLVALVLALFLGGLLRSEGLMGVAVGETKPDAPASYRMLSAGPLRGRAGATRAIRVDGFDTSYVSGGIDRGPVPTVSVLDASGASVKTQRIYPNNPLQTGSLTIHPVDFGFAATLSVLDATGTERGRAIQLIDVSADASAGTVPVEPLRFADDSGNELKVSVTVPMERRGGEVAAPRQRVADVEVARMDGSPVLRQTVAPGGTVTLPTGSTLRLDALDFYARLSVVDDPTIPLLYASLGVAMLGLALVAAVRQQLVVATVAAGERGPVLVAKVRLWRNAPTSRAEIEDELTRVLRGDEEKAS